METDYQIIRRLEGEVIMLAAELAAYKAEHDKLLRLNELHEKVGRDVLAENRELRVRLRTIHDAMEGYHG